jgi:hypothetical protein
VHASAGSSAGAGADSTAEALVAGLYVYPVKSCRGIAVRQARLGERGLDHDREWMIVDADGRFLTQREVPRLALVSVALSASELELSVPGLAPLAMALDASGPTRSVTVWSDVVHAIDQGECAAQWLSTWLGRPARLVRFDPKGYRACNPVYTGDTGAHTGFADAYPLLVLSEASLADLNARLANPLPMNRFRPNLVLSGIEAYDEDFIDQVHVGQIMLKLVKPCTRCRITTTDQSTGEVGIEPLPTLARYRQDTQLEGVTFGTNAIILAGTGALISVGARASCRFKF